ncbi:MAG: response regulator transcription factor [Bacteroidetes bacterium]|nr:response regulator transcription factor [Bacteroidota bacterium]
MKILIVEDEEFLSKNIADYLLQEGYICEVVKNFQQAQEKILDYDYDAILLDIGLPDGSGLQILKLLKEENKNEGVIIISAKNSLDDKIVGLNLGADDYLPKPFHLSELSARLSAIIRRKKFNGNSIITVNDISLDTNSKTAFANNKLLNITKMQYHLLLYFMVNKNRVLSKMAIAEHLSGDHAEYFDNYDVIYAHIKNLKKKIAEAGGNDCIKSVYGMGYKMEVL